MNLQCKPGDLAIITREDPGCEANIGRVVRVRGPIKIYGDVGATWLIASTTPEPWIYRVTDSNELHTDSTMPDDIEHPDAWMVPLRVQDSRVEVVEEEVA